MAFKRGTIGLVVVLSVATAVHIGYRVGQIRGAGPIFVSDMAAGSHFPDLDAAPISSEPPLGTAVMAPSTCKLFVVFSATCPHCRSAAIREASSAQVNRIPTIWLGVQSGELSAAFAELVAAESVVLYSANVKHRLRINAVPAAFLVGADNVIRRVWTYTGDEDHTILRAQCK